MAKKKSEPKGILETIEVEPLKVGTVQVWLKGQTPLIYNRMARKAKSELLLPGGPLTNADKQARLKHNPIVEYKDSMHVRAGVGPTRLTFPAPAVKGAMATAGLETKGTNKTQIGRLVWVKGYSLDVYGVPEFFMSVVRMADKNRTPDIRTRAILPEWCLPVTIQYVKPQMSEKAIFQLLCNGGIIIGIGDFRQEKGKGNFGQFDVVNAKDCKEIVSAGGLKLQDKAIKSPEMFDAESAELFAWFKSEVKRRGKEELLAA